ncbi:MAG TPA: hypothetical protein VHB02_14495 [Acidimicrobiales bacterium]|nr:hypothetical protein [Acidimicrobiales bacterium]
MAVTDSPNQHRRPRHAGGLDRPATDPPTEGLPARPAQARQGAADPEFAVAVRGYDRAQVDDYLAHLHQWLADSEARATAAEEAAGAANRELAVLRRRVQQLEERSEAPVPRSMAAFGERIGTLLEAAVEAADRLRAEADSEAKAARGAFAAEREAVLARARAEAEQLLEHARGQQQAIGRQIDQLDAKRSKALAELARVRQHLSDLLDAPPADDRGE